MVIDDKYIPLRTECKPDRELRVLGTAYTIKYKKEEEDLALKERELGGYCDDSNKTIVVREFDHDPLDKADMSAVQKEIIRHEVIHAFLSESGLKSNCDWATNEEMVDFFAIQLPKLAKTLKDYM